MKCLVFVLGKQFWWKFISPLQLCAASCKAKLIEDPFNRAIKNRTHIPTNIRPQKKPREYTSGQNHIRVNNDLSPEDSAKNPLLQTKVGNLKE